MRYRPCSVHEPRRRRCPILDRGPTCRIRVGVQSIESQNSKFGGGGVRRFPETVGGDVDIEGGLNLLPWWPYNIGIQSKAKHNYRWTWCFLVCWQPTPTPSMEQVRTPPTLNFSLSEFHAIQHSYSTVYQWTRFEKFEFYIYRWIDEPLDQVPLTWALPNQVIGG